ncbi:MAG: xanthine dehydrogenase family protein subunit M [Chloroflexi bacterium]|nr:xanthine dehydrogenase family protein subunit M [Chloroflexota bacterium]
MPRVLQPFEYLEPRSAAEATRILADYGTRAKAMAGGVDLLPRIRQRKICPEVIVSIQNIPGLDSIKEERGQLRIGALVTLHTAELDRLIKERYTALHEAVHHLASVQVKTMATLVGNLCVATPASDMAAALFVLGASLVVVSPDKERAIPIEQFFLKPGQTALQPGELVTEIVVPAPAPDSGSAFLKLVRTAADIAKVNAAVCLTVDGDACKEARIALGSVAPTTIRAPRAEAAIKGQKLTGDTIQAAARAAEAESRPITDVRSNADYRREMSGLLVGRAIKIAFQRARGQHE